MTRRFALGVFRHMKANSLGRQLLWLCKIATNSRNPTMVD